VGSDDLAALSLNLDETIGKNANSPADHYNTGETESGGGAQNGLLDDTSNKTVTLTTDSHSTAQIGELKSAQGSLSNL
ncbi:hypothetical protein NL496_29705, partial [Klebsiella pneumoniae]|nr:hypothetical protein [Klebsiella pneumoniae]